MCDYSKISKKQNDMLKFFSQINLKWQKMTKNGDNKNSIEFVKIW